MPPPLGRATVLAALALALSPAGAAAQDPAALVDAAIPHDSAISDQYQRVQEGLDQAAAVVPDQPLAPPVAESEPVAPPEPAPAAAAPDPKPPSEQYHSETPTAVNVTQQQPSNVNVSIRINSPGDDGPVVQINNAGGAAVVEQIVERATPPKPEPVAAAPTGGDLPDTWEWVWTSACFGGAPSASAAAATPGWSWRWSCDEAGEPGGDDVVAGLPAMFDSGVPDVDDLVGASGQTFAVAPAAAAAPKRPRARREPRAGTTGGGAGRAGPPPTGGAPAARSLVAGASAHAPPVSAGRQRQAVRAAAQARPGPGDDGASSTLPPGGGPGLGASTALGSVATILLGIWTAALATACVLALPRLRHRWWSGLTRRLTRLPSLRLERPG